MVFHRNLSDNKFPQVSRTFLSILTDLNSVLVWMVSTRGLISNYPKPFTNPLVTVPSAPTTIDITVTFMCHSFSVPTQSCLLLYSFCVNLLHSLIMWGIVSSQSPHNQHLLFCYVLCILTLIKLVFMALICAAIRSDSVSIKRFLFLSNIKLLSCQISRVCRLKYPYSWFLTSFIF